MRSPIILAGGALAVLSLAACQQNTNTASSQPLAAPTQAELAPAPTPTALPSAPAAPVRWAPRERLYSYIDDAYAMSQAYADAPPDYAFDYDGYAPEAWGSRDGVVRVGERVPGGWRFYYYQPGSDVPYLVRDPDYAYAFDGGQLVVVYDSHGRALDQSYGDKQAWLAGRYLARARALWQAARDNQRREVEAQVWRQQQADQARQRQYWAQSQQADPDWRSFSDQHRDQVQSRWTQTASAWAAVQAANPPPPAAAEGPRHDPVWAARETWRQRVAPQAPQGGAGFAAQPQPKGPAAPAGGEQSRLAQQQQAEAARQQQLQVQQQTSVEHQRQLQGQQQVELDRQRQLQAQQQASANRQHQLQLQQQAAAAGKHPQVAPPPPGQTAQAGHPAPLEPQKLQQEQRAIAAKHGQGAPAAHDEHHPESSHPPR
jgi:hypothetical protein